MFEKIVSLTSFHGSLEVSKEICQGIGCFCMDLWAGKMAVQCFRLTKCLLYISPQRNLTHVGVKLLLHSVIVGL